MGLDFNDLFFRLEERLGSRVVEAAFWKPSLEPVAGVPGDITPRHMVELLCEAAGQPAGTASDVYVFSSPHPCSSCGANLQSLTTDDKCRRCQRPTLESLPLPWRSTGTSADGAAVFADVRQLLVAEAGTDGVAVELSSALADVVPKKRRRQFWTACGREFGVALPPLEPPRVLGDRLFAAGVLSVPAFMLLLSPALIQINSPEARLMSGDPNLQVLMGALYWAIAAVAVLVLGILMFRLRSRLTVQFPAGFASVDHLVAFVLACRGQLAKPATDAASDTATLVWLHIRECIAVTVSVSVDDVKLDSWLIKDLGFN